jgi:hypothetical protein
MKPSSQLSRIASPRRWCNDTWSQYWNLCSMQTPMGIAPAGRHMMHWLWRGRDAGAMTGCLTSTFEVSSIVLHTAPLFMK